MVTGKRQTLVNPGRGSSSGGRSKAKAKKKGHRPRTKMSDKQLAIFGTPGQKRALARRKADKRAAAMTKRGKSSAKGRSASAGGSRKGTKNPAGIISLTLNKGSRKAAHPTQKGSMSMAATLKKSKKPGSTVQRSGGRRSGQPKKKPKRNPPRRGFGMAGLASSALFVIVGAVGSRLGTQALLGQRNAGIMGYLGNAGTGVGLSMLARWLMKTREASNAILLGTAVGIVLRVIADYTPLGEYARAAGLGDYQVSNWVTPQRYTNALDSSEVEIPAGWAPQIIAPANAGASAGLSAGGYGTNLYTGGGGLYS